MILCISNAYAAPAPTFDLSQITVDASQKTVNEVLSLSGNWGFTANQWLTQDQLSNPLLAMRVVTLPNYMHRLTPDSEKTSSYGTYIIRIQKLNDAFKRPSIRMKGVQEAWQAWWFEDGKRVLFLGESGKISKTTDEQNFSNKMDIIELPSNRPSGLLVIYVSSHHSSRSGLHGKLTIRKFEKNQRILLLDMGSRLLITGVGFYIIIQNLIFFIQRRKDTVFLLLAVFTFTGIARSAFSSGYLPYFIDIPSFTEFALRIEYILIFWPIIAGLHLIVRFFPFPKENIFLRLIYTMLISTAGLTLLIPLKTIFSLLAYYQLFAVIYTLAAVVIIIVGYKKNRPDGKLFLYSALPLLMGIANDIYAANTAGYGFFISEYMLFVFLFVQTQIQASKFVTALDVAEHLSINLQSEVFLKTKELTYKNMLLEEKADSLEKQHHQIKRLAETDHLTGLFNRQTLDERSNLQLEFAKTYSQPLTLVMMDLDLFKAINDEYGHQIGDECLVHVASYLRGLNLRRRDLIARYGGEEFILILTDTPLSAGAEIVQAICDGLSNTPLQGNHVDLYLTASFGIAEMQSSGARDYRELTRFADNALYQAKHNGRNQVSVYENPSS